MSNGVEPTNLQLSKIRIKKLKHVNDLKLLTDDPYCEVIEIFLPNFINFRSYF